MPKAFLVDTTRCTACRGCQLACKEWHDLPANETKQRGSHQNPPDLNPNNYKIVRFHEHLDKQGNVVWNFFPDQCRHCVTPICVDVADMAVPGAMIKDPKTGAVLVTDKIKKLSEQDMQTSSMPVRTISPGMTRSKRPLPSATCAPTASLPGCCPPASRPAPPGPWPLANGTRSWPLPKSGWRSSKRLIPRHSWQILTKSA